MRMDNEILISEVFKRKPLWDVSSKDFVKRDVRKKLWDEVANILNCNVDAVKKRWKSLKDNYRVELKKVKQKATSNSGVSSIKYTKWALFENLDFLRNVISEGLLERNLRKKSLIPAESDSQDKNLELNENNQEIFDNTGDSHLNIYDIDVTSQRINSPLPRPIKNKKRKFNSQKSLYLELEKEKLKILKEDQALREDADYSFLISFLPYMKKMSEIENLNFRMGMIKILLNMKEQELQNGGHNIVIPQTSSSRKGTGGPGDQDE